MSQRSAKTGTTGSTLSWLFTSTDGTVDVVTNATTGATTQSYRDPFGAPLPGTGQAWGDGTGYLNKPVSASIKLTTIGARVYDAVLGKFLSVDPVIAPNVPQQNIGYAYSDNNPTTYTDPTGLRFYITGNDGYVKRTGDHVGRPKTSSCLWGSPGCRGASTPTAGDGSRTGVVNVCRAFDSTTCERKDARVAPNSTGMSRDEVKKMTARTD